MYYERKQAIEMNPSVTPIVSLLCSFLFFSISWGASTPPDQRSFLQCLSTKSNASHPISESIYTSSNSSFSSILQSYIRNLRFNTSTTPKPLIIIVPLHESHVQATILCAKSNGLQLRIRSGGHDYEGLSYVSTLPFIILDMFNFRSISINMTDETAWVQSGATLGELYYKIGETSRVHGFPAGVCPTIGVGGHFGGGGYGNMMRKYGLSVDNIIDAEIVDVKGRILNRESMGEDLFWAIRGGGAGSFGVVLSWRIKLVRVPQNVTVFTVEKGLEEGGMEAILEWQKVADKLDEDLYIRLLIQPSNETIKAKFVALFLGDDERLLSLMNRSLPHVGLQKDDCLSMTWLESVLFWYTGTGSPTDLKVLLQRISKSESYLKRKSDYVKELIPRKGLESVFKLMIEAGNVGMAWNPYGGKMSNISESETPFPHRAGNMFKIQYSVNWKEDRVDNSNRNINWSRTIFDAMTPYVSKNPRQAFLAYRDLDIGTMASINGSYEEASVYGAKYFKSNFEGLVKVKTRVDPENFFRYEQSIPTLPK